MSKKYTVEEIRKWLKDTEYIISKSNEGLPGCEEEHSEFYCGLVQRVENISDSIACTYGYDASCYKYVGKENVIGAEDLTKIVNS